MIFDDTIAAVSTPRGKGGIAVIRISGCDTFSVIKRIFRSPSADFDSISFRHAYYGEILSPDGNALDTGMVTMYRGPHSYTGEDMAEVSCHGGVYITAEVLSSALASGARQAEAGEFTRRAFLNGKITLTEAEAIGMLLDADTHEKTVLAGGAVRGRLSKKIEEISNGLQTVLTQLYAVIDYPEEDLEDVGTETIVSGIDRSLAEIGRLLATYKRGKAIDEGVKTVITGRPNVGKSSLYNMMAGDDLAIVTDVAGTTRDVLHENISFGGVTLCIFDTAGIRDTDDKVEVIGVTRAEKEAQEAELLIAVFDYSSPLSDDDRRIIAKERTCPRIAVLNKEDLKCGLSEEDRKLIEENFDKTVMMSCEDRCGLDELEDEVGKLFDAGECDISSSPVIWKFRQKAALSEAEELLLSARERFLAGDPPDAVCTVCEEALALIGETDGRRVSENIVSEIFSKFCVGK